MTIRPSGQGREGDNYTALRGRATSWATRTSARSSCRASPRAISRSQPGRRRRREFPLRQGAQREWLPREVVTPGVEGGEMAGKGSAAWNDNFLHTSIRSSPSATIPRRHRVHQAAGVRKHFVDSASASGPSGWRKVGIEPHPHVRYNVYTDQ